MTREAERQRGRELAGPLAHLVDRVAGELHRNESLHLHDAVGPVEDCGYCYLRAGRALGVLATYLVETSRLVGDVAGEAKHLGELLASLPIYATRVGFRRDSTDAERKIGEAAFAAHEAFLEHREPTRA